MRNFFKTIDLGDVKDQITDIKDQLQDLKFRKPWTTGKSVSPVVFVAAGAALAVVGLALFRNRAEVARLCSNCGTDLKARWNNLGMKDKAEDILDKVNGSAKPSENAMGRGASEGNRSI